MSGDTTSQHTRLVDSIRLALGREPDLTLWPNPVKHVEVPSADGRVVHLRTGLAVGSADLIGILAPAGRLVALEVKTGRAVASPQQVMWAELVRRRGGFAAVVRSVEEATAALERARRGERA